MTVSTLPEKFEGASILLPLMDETISLIKTIETIESQCAADVTEYLFLVCKRTKPESLELCNRFVTGNPTRFRVVWQQLPFLGGAVRDGFAQAKASHVVMMASDLETNPNDVKELIRLARANPKAIVTASRWSDRGVRFEGYSKLKLVLNWSFQQMFRALYWTKLTDLTYGYRIFPTALVQSIRWERLRHDFLFETLIKPLRLGTPVLEIPTVWQARQEGQSYNTFFRNFHYFWIGTKVRFTPKQRVMASPAETSRNEATA